MGRSRDWRRWRSELKEERLRKRLYARALMTFNINQMMRYTRRVSPLETEQIVVETRDDVAKYSNHSARKERDNPTSCSCWMCCNTRRGVGGNRWQALTEPERQSLQCLNVEMEYEEIDVLNSNHRRLNRGWRRG